MLSSLPKKRCHQALTRRAGFALLASLLIFNSGYSYAERQTHDISGPWKIGGSVGLYYTQSDNFFYQSSQGASVRGYSIRPEAGLEGQFSRGEVALKTNADWARFNVSNGADDYFNYGVSLTSHYEANIRNNLFVDSAFQRGQDPAGALRTLNNPTPNEWQDTKIGGQYRFGAPEADMNILIGGASGSKRYTNNFNQTTGFDSNKRGFLTTVFYKLAKKTNLLLDYQQDFLTFPVNIPGGLNRDSSEQKVRTGIAWKATGKTTGDLRIGYFRRTPKDPAVSGSSGLDWNATLTWVPESRSTLKLNTGRSSEESFLVNSSVTNATSAGLEWIQKWSKRFQSTASLQYQEQNFVGLNQTDKTLTTGLGIEYEIAKYAQAVASITRSQKFSEQAGVEYVQTSGFVGLKITP